MRAFGLASVLAVALVASPAQAEWFEKQVGIEGVVLFPRFGSDDPTAFRNVSPGTQLHFSYGVLHDLYLTGRFTAWLQSGVVKEYRHEDPTRGEFVGDLSFNGEGYRGEVGACWTMLSGFNLAPRLEVNLGYQWTTYRNPDLGDAQGSYGLQMDPFGSGALTAGGSLIVDYRIFQMVLVGARAGWTYAFGDLYGDDLAASVFASFYWF